MTKKAQYDPLHGLELDHPRVRARMEMARSALSAVVASYGIQDEATRRKLEGSLLKLPERFFEMSEANRKLAESILECESEAIAAGLEEREEVPTSHWSLDGQGMSLVSIGPDFKAPELTPEEKLVKCDRETPPLDLASPDWISVGDERMKCEPDPPSLKAMRHDTHNGAIKSQEGTFGMDKSGRVWRKVSKKALQVYYYLPSLNLDIKGNAG